MGCTETSARNYQSTLRNILEEHSSHLRTLFILCLITCLVGLLLFKAICRKSVKHSHMYFYVNMSTCFDLRRLSSGRHYKIVKIRKNTVSDVCYCGYCNVKVWNPVVWIITDLYFALFWLFFLRVWWGHVQTETCEGKVAVKVKINLEQATKAQKGSRGMGLLFP